MARRLAGCGAMRARVGKERGRWCRLDNGGCGRALGNGSGLRSGGGCPAWLPAILSGICLRLQDCQSMRAGHGLLRAMVVDGACVILFRRDGSALPGRASQYAAIGAIPASGAKVIIATLRRRCFVCRIMCGKFCPRAMVAFRVACDACECEVARASSPWFFEVEWIEWHGLPAREILGLSGTGDSPVGLRCI